MARASLTSTASGVFEDELALEDLELFAGDALGDITALEALAERHFRESRRRDRLGHRERIQHPRQFA